MSYYACPFCGRPMDWIPTYSQYWCNGCQRYHAAPRNELDSFLSSIGNEFAAPPPPACNRCGAPTQFIPQYQRWFCHRCQQYL
ncbi:MAG: hypothetical protein Q7J68_06530 [Thermoplasmata archaeon]|nr:hypothetical protein [Thermoplasmata archaeon]